MTTPELRRGVLVGIFTLTAIVQPQTGLASPISEFLPQVERTGNDIDVSGERNYHVGDVFEAKEASLAYSYEPVAQKNVAQEPEKPKVAVKAQTDMSVAAKKAIVAQDAVTVAAPVKTVAVASENIAQPVSTGADVPSLITKYAQEYGVSAQMMLDIATCESGMREAAVNGSYGGIYQFNSSTWSSNRVAMGLDPNPNLRFNAEESARTAAFKMSRDGFGAWPACSVKAASIATSEVI